MNKFRSSQSHFCEGNGYLQNVSNRYLLVLDLQFLLVDLRCHGESALIQKRGPHSVASAARDVLQLVRSFLCAPYLLIRESQ